MLARRDFLLFAALSVGSVAADSIFVETALADIGKTSRKPLGNHLIEYRDSFDRTLAPPASIKKVFPLGMYAQTVLYSLDPQLILADTATLTDSQRRAAVWGKTDESDLQPLDDSLGSAIVHTADLIIDFGSRDKSSAESLSLAETKTGTTSAFFDGSFEALAASYRELGEMLGVDGYEACAAYIEEVVDIIMAAQAQIERTSPITIYIATGESGLRAATYNYLQTNALDYLNVQCINNVIIESSAPDQNEEAALIDLSILAETDPHLVLFRDANQEDLSSNSSALSQLWRNMPQVSESRYVFGPAIELSWLGAPLISQCLGILWLANTLRSECFTIDVADYAVRFYRLFARCNVSRDDMLAIVNTDRG